ncbi:hypothetical protein [Clostridium ihumii]|uniref:hypothetical protein n=1 Tax=Clostridium ihumii TaxID=1470356 RepID=UPI0006882CB7|nr:hypothetical protein [Clostridium ihumii]
MNENIDNKIQEAKTSIELKKNLMIKIENLNSELKQQLNEFEELKKVLVKEEKDVRKLEGISFASLLSKLLKNREEKLEKEQKEYIEVKIKYDEFKFKISEIQNKIKDKQKRLKELENIETDYNELLDEKIKNIKLSNEEINKFKLLEYENMEDSCIKERTEINEALTVGQELLDEIELALNSFESAKNWGTLDILGGDFLSSIAKHSKIEDATENLHKVSYLIESFNKELRDVYVNTEVLDVNISSFTKTFDIFFDNIFSDISVQNEINGGIERVVDLKAKINNVMNNLEERKRLNERNLKNLKKEYYTFIENA